MALHSDKAHFYCMQLNWHAQRSHTTIYTCLHTQESCDAVPKKMEKLSGCRAEEDWGLDASSMQLDCFQT